MPESLSCTGPDHDEVLTVSQPRLSSLSRSLDSIGFMEKSRIGAARARAATAKRTLLASAVALFFAAMLAARATHAAQASHSSSSSTASSTAAADSFGSSSEDFDPGSLAPAQSVPQVATGSS
jgi:uncharacterized protein YfaQ (DUF2300 family)